MSHQEMLINYVPGEECRIAIVEDGRLEEFYQERASAELHVGNIYKARVVSVEPSIQAAFIDFGLDRNGFLHITDVHPMYFPASWKGEDTERVGQKTRHRDRPPIQSCLHRGQEILVQVLKEGIGSKGPTVTSYLSIPGRFLVMMPFMERLGVSRKVEDEQVRREMRQILDELNPPKEFGFIIRTAGIGRTKAELKRDLAYLVRLWKAMEHRRSQIRNVGELYTEADLIIRTIRDVFSTAIERIIVDDESAAQRAQSFLAIANPRTSSKVFVHTEQIPLFHRHGIEQQIENINARQVPLPSGGSLVIDTAEALVAVDVNSGKYRDNRDAEMTAYKTNIEACDEVCRQLRLRDLGGVVVIDLIDMRSHKHRREIEQRFRNNLKNDRARTRISSISQFGILEMTRQRMRPSLKKSIYMDCPNCHGRGQVKSRESVVLDVMRRLAFVLFDHRVAKIDLTISPDVAFQLLNVRRRQLVALEEKYGKLVMVRVGGPSIDYIQMAAYDGGGNLLNEELLEAAIRASTPSQPMRPAGKPVEGEVFLEADEIEEERSDTADTHLQHEGEPSEDASVAGGVGVEGGSDDLQTDSSRPIPPPAGAGSGSRRVVSSGTGEGRSAKPPRDRRRPSRGRGRRPSHGQPAQGPAYTEAPAEPEMPAISSDTTTQESGEPPPAESTEPPAKIPEPGNEEIGPGQLGPETGLATQPPQGAGGQPPPRRRRRRGGRGRSRNPQSPDQRSSETAQPDQGASESKSGQASDQAPHTRPTQGQVQSRGQSQGPNAGPRSGRRRRRRHRPPGSPAPGSPGTGAHGNPGPPGNSGSSGNPQSQRPPGTSPSEQQGPSQGSPPGPAADE